MNEEARTQDGLTEFEKAVKATLNQMKGVEITDESVKLYSYELLKAAHEQIVKSVFIFDEKHNTACILASECLREHGWFERERDFNDLWKFLSTQKELFNGEFHQIKQVKIGIINNDLYEPGR